MDSTTTFTFNPLDGIVKATNKISLDCILLIMNCQKYRYKALIQQQNWLENFTLMPYFHVIGNIDLEIDHLFDYTEKILYVKVADDYNSLPKKVITAYNAIYQEYSFKYIFKTDDDQLLTNIHFLFAIQNKLINNVTEINKIHYGGDVVNVNKPYLSQYYKIHPELPKHLPVLQTKYCSGRFYFLSNVAIEYLLMKIDLIGKEYLEDYAIGFYLDNSFKTNMLNLQTNKYFIDIV
jgi:hypothetical protein